MTTARRIGKRFGPGLALIAAGGLAACGASPAPRPSVAPAPDVDVAAHTARMVEVAPGVELEVLDFGGEGAAMVLLAGLGNTGHVFDDLGPKLAATHHVYAITRRGYGRSTAAAEGYDDATRVADDLAVLDALAVERAVLVGHSIAGDELTGLAARHPSRVRALVYLDAAVDHIEAGALLAKAPPMDFLAPTEAAMASLAAMRSFDERVMGLAQPLGESLAAYLLGPDGRIQGYRGNPQASSAIIAGVAAAAYASIQCPALVLTAGVADAAELIGPPWATLDAAQRAAWAAFFTNEAVPFNAAQRARVQAELRGAVELVYPHHHHYLFLQSPDRVVADIATFLAAVP